MSESSKIVIGLIGKKGSGKQKFVNFSNNMWGAVLHVKTGGIIGETLDIWHLPRTRENMQKLPVIMENGFGKGLLSNAAYQKIKNSAVSLVIFDAVRWESDVKMIRKFQNSYLVFIDTDERLRYERIKNRGEKPEEKNLSFEKFKEEEGAETEIYISDLSKNVDFVITNNGTPEEFYRKVQRFYDSAAKNLCN